MSSPLTAEQREFLRNPFYYSLITAQTEFAEKIGDVLRYRPDVLPFSSVASSDVMIDAEMLRGDTDVNFAGVIPQVEADIPGTKIYNVLQMARHPRADFAVPHPMTGESELGEADAEDMVELTNVAFPGYYRRESYRLGRYIGLRIDGQLVAMAGHRTRMPGLREISAVCTRPGSTGRGYAQHLIQRLLNATGELPYLHVVNTNARAIPIYERLGFVHTGEVPLLHIPRRTGAD